MLQLHAMIESSVIINTCMMFGGNCDGYFASTDLSSCLWIVPFTFPGGFVGGGHFK